VSRTVLITGGFGYLGGRIAQSLAANPDISLRIATRQANPVPPEWLGACETVTLDLMSEGDLAAACTGVSCVVHLAALNEIDSSADPEKALLVNTLGSLKLLRAAERAGVKRCIYFSTAHVYGAPLAGIITEETLPRPAHPYATTHRAAEDFVLAAHDRRALDGIVVRLSNGFGAPAHPDVNRWTLLVNDLCRQAAETGTLQLRSSGLQRRDFITLHDVGRAVDHLIALPPDACGDGLFNLGGESPLRIIDLTGLIAERCATVLGFVPTILRPEPLPEEKPLPLDFRIDKLKRTGFFLEGDFTGEIDATLTLCRDAFGKRRHP
jgi:UDP-glucose 4-epimerase